MITKINIMQKTLIIFALFFSYFFLMNAQKEQLDQLFEKYQNTEGITSIKIAKPMFNLLNNLNIADEELAQIKPLLSKINGLKILIIEKSDNEKPLLQVEKLQADISSSIKLMKYEELITVNSKGNKIKFLAAEAKNGFLDNLLLSINSDGNILLMMLDGKISMDDVNNLINETQKSTTQSFVATENKTSTGIMQVRTVGQFSGVSASSGIKVNFTQGKNQSVVVETDPNLQEYISTEVENGILVIAVKNKNNRKLNFKKLLVTIEAPHLSSVKVSSGSVLTTLNTIYENDFQAAISSGADLNADLNIQNKTNVSISSGSSMRMTVKTTNFDLEGSSGSMASIVGSAENTSIKVSSAATCNAEGLVSKNGSAIASSGANIKINAMSTLTASASSGAVVRYIDHPQMTDKKLKSSSGGSIKPID